MTPEQCLAALPDMTNWDTISPWVQEMLARIENNKFPADTRLTAVSLEDLKTDPVIGVYGSSDWRRFTIGCFLADWACYTKPADRADFPRLVSVVATFPQGFRLYFASLQDGTPVPVAYTGWYPILSDVFQMLENSPQSITHRGMMLPLRNLAPTGNFLYMFNASIIPAMVNTAQSTAMTMDLARSLKNVPKKGASSVTVSDHGIRMSEKFGMTYTGDITHDGESERVYCVRFD